MALVQRLLILAVLLLFALPSAAAAFPNGRAPASALEQVRHPSAKVYLERGGAAASFNTFSICSERAGRTVYLNGPNSGYRRYGPINVYAGRADDGE